VLTWATSAATAQVARLCAQVLAEYPSFWPETIRALVVHSAEWTPAMRAHLKGAAGKRERASLVRRYGFGVPSAVRALRSARDSLTLVAQAVIRPFADGKMREMNLFELPWPKAELEALGDAPVRMRVTLSYFVEPNPARRGWKKRHRYQSHGLRFEVKKGSLESIEDFRKRLNQRALDEEEERPSAVADAGWYLGEQTRNLGSVHSDVWVGTAADLAERSVIAVYPVTGWWKEQAKRDRSEHGVRYSLVVSIETPTVETDIWTLSLSRSALMWRPPLRSADPEPVPGFGGASEPCPNRADPDVRSVSIPVESVASPIAPEATEPQRIARFGLSSPATWL